MKYVIVIITLAVKESLALNPEILKYNQYMKDFEGTGRALKQEKTNKNLDESLLVKREEVFLAQPDDSEPANQTSPTVEEMKATPEYKYRMTVVLALQVYWLQIEAVELAYQKHNDFYVAKHAEMPQFNQVLNDTSEFIEEKIAEIKGIYKLIYSGNITWAERMTIIPISQESIDYISSQWKKSMQIFEEHGRKKKLKNVSPEEIDKFYKGLKTAEEDCHIQYETLKKYMKKVLKRIEDIRTGASTKSEFDELLDEINASSTQSGLSTTTPISGKD